MYIYIQCIPVFRLMVALEICDVQSSIAHVKPDHDACIQYFNTLEKENIKSHNIQGIRFVYILSIR